MKSPSQTQTVLACALLLVSLAISSTNAEKPAPDPKQSLATKYFEALFSGNAAEASALSGAPFSQDRKKVLTTKEQVEAIHLEIAEKKGKRDIPEYTVAKTDDAPKLDAETFPKYVVYRINVGKEAIDIYVTDGENPKVIGFSD